MPMPASSSACVAPSNASAPSSANRSVRIERKVGDIGQAVRQVLAETLNKARCTVEQSGQRKAVDAQPKLYAWHAPEVECIS